MSDKVFGIRSAYGQLILLVFLPIVILAAVGGYIVLSETRRAFLSEQDVLAQAALIRYEPLVRSFLESHDFDRTIIERATHQMSLDPIGSAITPKDERQIKQSWLAQIQQASSQHVLRVTVMDSDGDVLVSTGVKTDEQWEKFDTNAKMVHRLPTKVGMAYGMPIWFDGGRYWVMVDMDDEPLTIAYYRVLLALSITGLMTVLLLLLILTIYSKRWIAPLYEMRLYLQQLNADNLSHTPQIRTDGEFALLKKDFAKAIRRLDSSFTELKNHAAETERDLQQAFDEMEMQNISIRNARDAAISASQAKSAFLTNISHELRTPLNSIDGFINLLARKQGLTSEQNLYVQTIKKSSAHLLAVVNDVLDFSKIEAGKLALDRHDFDLYAAVYDVVDMLSPAASEKRLRLAVLFYNDVPTTVVGDGLRVKQILTNLVGNAIKFTDTGGVIVRVGLADRAGFLRIEVEDTGKGISENDKAQLFQSFSQGDLSVTRRYGGTGLGLVISKQLTVLMGGAIGFFDNHSENIANTGATFWFEMPAGVPIDDEALPALPMALQSSQQADQPAMQILVWINHEPALQALKSSLVGTGIKVVQTIGLADLLERLDHRDVQYDWVIVDHFGQDAAKDDIGAILRQIRLRYHGKLASYGYQVGMDAPLLTRYQAYGLYEPMDRRQLYAMLSDKWDLNHDKTQQVRFDGKCVLAVDDHLPNLLVLEALLGEMGVSVITAENGFEAIEKMNQSITGTGVPIDLVFMDMQMPRMSGLEAAMQIRKIEEAHLNDGVPIIALTAHGLSDEKDRLVAAGMNDYAGKPIGQVQLVQLLKKWLNRSDDTAQFDTQIQPVIPDGTPDTHTNADIDWQDALERSANKADLAYKLLTMIIETAETDKQALERAWADRDRYALIELTHRMVGASRYAGVPRLRATSEQFEQQCRANPEAVSASEFVALRPAYRALIDALDGLQVITPDALAGMMD